MNKSVKKTLLFMGSLIVVIVIITCVYLLVLTKPDSGTDTSPSGTIMVPPTETAAIPSPTDTGTYTREETADGSVYHITVPGAFVAYSITADDSVYDFKLTDGQARLTAKADEKQFLNIMFYEGAKAAELVPTIPDKFINYKEFEQSGEDYIPGTVISGETVAADDGQTRIEAWLVGTDKGVLAVVISYDMLKKDAETAALYQLLGTLSLDARQ